MPTSGRALTAVAISATLHCLTGCAIGEILGMAIGTALGFSDWGTVALAVALAFVFGYSLTSLPLLRAGFALGAVIPIALASDTFSIAVMELVDNLVVIAVPGALEAGLGTWLFWGSLSFALSVAFVAAVPVNRWLIARGKGHAVVHRRGPRRAVAAPRRRDRRRRVRLRRRRADRRGVRIQGCCATATTADLPELSAIKSAVSRRAYGGLMTEEQLAWWLDVGCSQERFAPHLDDPHSTVLLDDETRAVGTVTFAEAAYISDVYVERAGEGGGRRMVDALVSLARERGLPQAECSVMGWSADAVVFWTRMGFTRGRFLTQPSFDRARPHAPRRLDAVASTSRRRTSATCSRSERRRAAPGRPRAPRASRRHRRTRSAPATPSPSHSGEPAAISSHSCGSAMESS